MEIFIWGTGNNAKKCLEKMKFRKEVRIIGLLENDDFSDLKYGGRKELYY